MSALVDQDCVCSVRPQEDLDVCREPLTNPSTHGGLHRPRNCGVRREVACSTLLRSHLPDGEVNRGAWNGTLWSRRAVLFYRWFCGLRVPRRHHDKYAHVIPQKRRAGSPTRLCAWNSLATKFASEMNVACSSAATDVQIADRSARKFAKYLISKQKKFLRKIPNFCDCFSDTR